MLSPNIILPYDNTHASIPATFTRETALDGRFIKGTATSTNPNVTGGASTHTHTSSTHTHSLTSHTHTTGTTGRYDPPPDGDSAGGGLLTTGHEHSSSTSNGPTEVSTAASAPSYSSASNNPPYYEVIFIKSSLHNFIPQSAMILTTATSRSQLTYHTSSAGKYLRGAATSGDAGATGGSYDNSHDMSHTHSPSHYHTGTTSTGPGGGGGGPGGGGNAVTTDNHNHSYTTTTHTDTLNAPTTTTYVQFGASGENIEPVYKTLNPFKNSSGGSVVPIPGDIGLWLGTLATIPLGWALCDGSNGTPDMRDRFLKMTPSATSSTTGGSNTHAHPGISHSHATASSHTHNTSSTQGGSTSSSQGLGGGGRRTGPNHTHTLPNMQTQTSSYGSATITPDSSDNQPLFTTVAYVQMIYETIGAGALALL